jgi:pyruvate/2-oxoglutarate/acetoin dehydrogenase E1 component/TPP-dependent pyruvate/acetoin dehydrogenase alpha subunit
MGKAKFGIFGDGKELPQIAMAKAFKRGDVRSGYYRDQTFMLSLGELTVEQYFAQLYAHTDVNADPASAGRLMNGHFATRSLDDQGHWKDLLHLNYAISDVSPTAGQIPRIIGLGYASKLYRNNPELHNHQQFSNKGNEVVFGTIGNAATSEGMFLEAINAMGVLQIPVVMAIWDDDYGISVPNEYHTTKGDISEALMGFQRTSKEDGFEIFKVKGWDYQALCNTFERAAELSRESHVPTLIHVTELTQPQGHSTSGSHERYKSPERLEWEREHDCIKKFREWLIDREYATASDLDKIEKEAKITAKAAKNAAWKAFNVSMRPDLESALAIMDKAVLQSSHKKALADLKNELETTLNPLRSDVIKCVKKAVRHMRNERISIKQEAINWIRRTTEENLVRYSSHLYSESSASALKVKPIKPKYSGEQKLVDGRKVLQACFDQALSRDPAILAFGEDVGKIGDVNQAFAGLQAKYGELRVTDTGIREITIIGQGIGAAMRGLRPIAEIQYLDYLVYALATITDDLSTLQYRTRGGQKAPLIIRTRGHRLEGMWHAGSPISMILGSMRGIYLLVPRNMTQAAGFYNTLLQSDDTALIIECLNGYRLKERVPDNVGEFTVPLGEPEVIREGTDVTVVTYGSMCRIVMEAAQQLQDVGISTEVIDVQTLLPFDLSHRILESVKKTNRVLFTDEDVPGGGSAYMMQQVLEKQGAYKYLDANPATLSGKDHRPAYGSDGDYFSKPNVEEVFEKVYTLMSDSDPIAFPDLY